MLLLVVLSSAVFLAVSLPVRLHVMYSGDGKKHSVVVRFYIVSSFLAVEFAARPDEREKKAEIIIGRRARLLFFRHGGEKSEGDRSFALSEVVRRYRSLKEIFEQILLFMRRCFCRRLVLSSSVGFEDYALTGFAAGLLWAFQGCLLRCLLRELKFSSEGPVVRVTPHFGKEIFEVCLDCILETRLGNIMVQLVKFFFWWQRRLLQSSVRR